MAKASGAKDRQPMSAEAVEKNDLPPALDPADGDGRRIEAFIRTYYDLWNRRDAKAVWGEVYRLGPGHRLGSEEDLGTLFAAMVADGWHRSSIEEIGIHPVDEGEWIARVVYTRWTADGQPMPPARRLTAYAVSRPDGALRITGLPLSGRPLIEAR